MTAAAATFDRYQRHKLKGFEVPENLTRLQRRAIKHLEQLFFGRRDWKIKGFNAAHAAQVLKTNTLKGETRAARSQRLHTDFHVLAALISRLNLDPQSNMSYYLRNQ